ncbi:TPA: hypothetical protein U1247_000676 [Streptococcus suis]|nr:hypothetical protein [Streptococcus suis]
MDKRLRLFHFSKDEIDVNVEQGIVFDNNYDNFSDISEDIDIRVLSSKDDRNVKNFRFRRPTSELVTSISEIFESRDNFERYSQIIADRFKESIGRRFQKDFYLVVFVTHLDSEDLLFIAKLETNTAIQVSDQNTLTTLKNVLPDSKSRLHKAAVIYKERTIDFKENREEVGRERDYVHSRVLDRSDENISEYFLSQFLESDPVIDNPEAAAKIAVDSILNVTKPYLLTQYKPENVDEKLRLFLSEKQSTSFEGLIGQVSNFIDFDNPDRPIDAEKLATEAYELAKWKNNTVLQTFEAKFQRPPRKTFISIDQNGDKKFKISYYISLESQDIVSWEEDENYKILKIDKDLLPIEERRRSNDR